MEIDQLKKTLQNHFSDGLITLVGSGLSVAAGLPTMAELADHLKEAVAGVVTDDIREEWSKVETALSEGKDLESALKEINTDSPLLPLIVSNTINLIGPKEEQVISGLFSKCSTLPFAKLLLHITFSTDRHTVITTNYDRLIEIAAEMAGFAVDTLFDGRLYGRCDKQASKYSVGILDSKQRGVGIKVKYRKHIAVMKPHGSLDWYDHDGTPVRCLLSNSLNLDRLMIVPGGNKYRKGYDAPFDLHRSEANSAIDKAARFLVIGYGFNDDHLETHLRQELRKGKPCLVLNRQITANLQSLIADCPNMIVLSECADGTKVHSNGIVHEFNGLKLWELDSFIEEVLKT